MSGSFQHFSHFTPSDLIVLSIAAKDEEIKQIHQMFLKLIASRRFSKCSSLYVI